MHFLNICNCQAIYEGKFVKGLKSNSERLCRNYSSSCKEHRSSFEHTWETPTSGMQSIIGLLRKPLGVLNTARTSLS